MKSYAVVKVNVNPEYKFAVIDNNTKKYLYVEIDEKTGKNMFKAGECNRFDDIECASIFKTRKYANYMKRQAIKNNIY